MVVGAAGFEKGRRAEFVGVFVATLVTTARLKYRLRPTMRAGGEHLQLEAVVFGPHHADVGGGRGLGGGELLHLGGRWGRG